MEEKIMGKEIFDPSKKKHFKTCKEYAEYMAGDHDDARDLRYNPVPEDALSLEELGKLSKQKILQILNKMGKTPNKSDIRVMFANGLGFSWQELQTAAKVLGFKTDTENSRMVHYYYPGEEEVVDAEKEDERLLVEANAALKAGKRDSISRDLFTFKEDTASLRNYVSGKVNRGMVDIVQAIILSKLIRGFLKEHR